MDNSEALRQQTADASSVPNVSEDLGQQASDSGACSQGDGQELIPADASDPAASAVKQFLCWRRARDQSSRLPRSLVDSGYRNTGQDDGDGIVGDDR